MIARLSATISLGAVLFGISIGANAEQTKKEPWPYKDATPDARIEYVRTDIPDFPLPFDRGRTYESLVPDTLDLAERARLAINALTNATNPNQDHEQYFSLYIGNPLRMAHNFSDWCTPKYMEALPLLRDVSGSKYNLRVDRVWMDVVLKSIGPDGLFYYPIVGKPWYGKEMWWANGIARADGSVFVVEKPNEELLQDLDTYALSHAHSVIEESGIKQFTHPQPCGRIINVMTVYYLYDQNPIWDDMIRRMIDRMLELVIDKGEYCYFPPYLYEPNAKFDPKNTLAEMPKGLQGGEINGRFIKAPALYYKMTGYEPARELAGKLTNYMLRQADYFGPNGEFTGDRHFHAHTNYIFGILEYAAAVEDRDLLEYIRKSYEWAKSPEAGSSELVGFFPETADPSYPTSEGCAVADMVAWAVKLSAAGAGDYYEDAERWGRNYFSEIQLTRPRVNDLVRHGKTMETKKLLNNETDDGVAERNLGAFASWSTGNEWWGGHRDTDNLIMHCCTGNATRALYYLWRHILDYQDGALRVNMLLNRASPWVDVFSHIPYEGKVRLEVKKDCTSLMVHAPEWVPSGSDEIVVTIDGRKHGYTWKDRYLDLGSVGAGREVILEFAIGERSVPVNMGDREYTVVVKGNTVVHIDPPGRVSPIFQRDHYRSNQVRWRKVQRYVSDEPILY